MRPKRVRISVSLTEEDQEKLEFVGFLLKKKTKSAAVRAAIDFIFTLNISKP